MPAAKTFDRATLRILHPDGAVLFERVRVVGRVGDVVELYGLRSQHPTGSDVDGSRAVVLVARFEHATIEAVGAREWLLRIDADTYRMTRDGNCSTCGRSAPLAAFRP